MKHLFNQSIFGVLSETAVRTPCPGDEYVHYEVNVPYGLTEKSLLFGWKDELTTLGFVLHHEDETPMQNTFLTSERFLCKVTCVRGYINVQFFSSIEAMQENRRKTMIFINQCIKPALQRKSR